MHHRLRRLVLIGSIACVPALGTLLGVAGTATAGTATTPATTSSPGAQAATAARNAIKQMVIGEHGNNHAMSGHALAHTARGGVSALNQVTSTNWAGYADDSTGGHTYSKITGNWAEPSASCTSTESLAAFWIGIDGYTSSSVEQDGTLVECYRSTAYYYTWWEMYPSNAIQVVGSSVRPGDSISTSVTKSGSSYKLTVTDSTHPANSFSTTQSCSGCAASSAEWIAEAPSGSSGVEPLTNFHSWTASGATVTSGSTSGVISSFPDDELTMINNSGAVKAQPGALNGSGNGFTVTWERSS
ncbi:MAG TPA: G1 family glutamic endopeptidase [Streptosporangiaceae bacterium]